MSGTAEMFFQALKAVYDPSSPPAVQAQANQWLNQFSAQHEAWEVAFSLLDISKTSHDASHQFFAANMLCTKVRTEWGKLSSDAKAHVHQLVSSLLQQHLQHQAASSALVPSRLAMVLSAIAVKSGSQAAAQLVPQAIRLITSGHAGNKLPITCGLCLLTEICSEAAALDTPKAMAMQKALQPCCADVLNVAQQLFTDPETAAGGSVAGDVLKCVQAWSGDWSSMGTRHITAANLHAGYPALYSNLFNLVACQSPPIQELASGLVSSLLSSAPDDLEGPEFTTWLTSAKAAVSHLTHLGQHIHTPGAYGAAVARGVGAAGTALAEACAEFAAGALPGETEVALQLATLMMACLSRRERSVADAVLDYLINLNTIPVAKRIGPLQSDIYANSLPILLKQAEYPSDFTTWEDECEEDEDAFTRSREYQLQELLESCYAVLGSQYLAFTQSYLDHAPAWQAYEAGLYAVRAVNMPLKLAMLGRDRADQCLETRPAEQLSKARDGHAMMLTLTTALTSQTPGSVAHKYVQGSPWVCKEACRLIAEYAAWFGKANMLSSELTPAGVITLGSDIPPAPLLPAVQLALHSLQQPICKHIAAQAFRNLCVRCTDQLTSKDVLPTLVNAALQSVSPPPEVSLQQHQQNIANPPAVGTTMASVARGASDLDLIMEGIGRLVSALPVEEMGPAGQGVIQPLAARAQAFAQAGVSGGAGSGAMQLLSQELQLMASAIQFMCFPGHPPPGQPHPALQVLESAWPVLSGVAQHEACRQEAAVVDGLCDVYKRSLISSRTHGKDLLQPLITSVVSIQASKPHPGCCAVLGTVVEMFGELKSVPHIKDMQAQALEATVAAVVNATQTATQQGGHVPLELLAALYHMADLYYVFARDTLLASPSLQQFVQLGCSVVRLREREPVVAGLSFLTHTLGSVDKLTGDAAQAQRAALETCMTATGPQLVHALMLAVADSCPRQLARPLAGLLYCLLYNEVWGPAAKTWLATSIASPEFTGACGHKLNQEEVSRVLAIINRQQPLFRGKFDVFIADLSSVLRAEADADSLLAYEM